MNKKEILKKLADAWDACISYQKTEPTAFIYGYLKEAVRQILHEEKSFNDIGRKEK
jgi:hypothetical protein